MPSGEATNGASPVSPEALHEIEQFLYREARLLDEEQYRDWLGMMTEDVHYWMPVTENRFRRDKRPPISEKDLAYYNDKLKDLDMRVARFETGMVWTEDPPNRTRHIITNIEANWVNQPSEAEVFSNFVVYRNRRHRDEATLIGGRQDVLRKVGGQWKLARRKIMLAQNLVLDKNLGVFF
jgi:ethylbenzene dioxygenase subunit beta